MKNKFKSILALCLVLILSFTMIIPLGAVDYPYLSIYIGNEQPYEDMYIWVDDAVTVEYTAGDKFDEIFADYIPEYWNITGWERWDLSHDFLGEKKATYAKGGSISADETDMWYGDILFPIHTDLRKITKQPTAVSPTVEVTYPDGAEYQWFKEVSDDTFVEFTPDHPFFDGYCCGTYSNSSWDSLNFYLYTVDLEFNFSSGDDIKITFSSDAEDFDAYLFDYDGILEFEYNEDEDAWYAIGTDEYEGNTNIEFWGSSEFTLTIEIIKNGVSNPIVDENASHVYDGTYNEELGAWEAGFLDPGSYDYIDFYVQDVPARTVFKVTPIDVSDDFQLDLYSNHYEDECETFKDGDSYYLVYPDYDIPYDNIYIESIESEQSFKAKIEVASGSFVLEGENAPTLSEVLPDETYFCIITWPDGFSLTSDSLALHEISSSPSGFYLPFLLLMRRMRYFDGDEMVDWQRVDGGQILEPLALEDKDGMTLEGWYIDKALTEKFDFTQPIKAGRKLYAKWVEAPIEEEVPDEETLTDEVTTETEEAITSEETE